MNGKDVRIGVSLLVGDIENMVRFYRDTLGFQTQWSGGPLRILKLQVGNCPYLCIAGKNL